MSRAMTLRFGGLHVERDRLNEHARRVPLAVPRITLRSFTDKGTARETDLTRANLVDLIADAALALRALDQAEADR